MKIFTLSFKKKPAKVRLVSSKIDSYQDSLNKYGKEQFSRLLERGISLHSVSLAQ